MANHTQVIKLDGSLTPVKVYDTLQDINNDIFNGLLPLHISKNLDYFEVCEAVGEKSHEGISMWIEQDFKHYKENDDYETIKGMYLDIRQGHGSDFYWWLDHLIICELANRLDGIAIGEGFNYTLDKPEEGYKYNKNFRDYLYKPYHKTTWLEMLHNRFRVRVTKDRMKYDLSPELYEYVWKIK